MLNIVKYFYIFYYRIRPVSNSWNFKIIWPACIKIKAHVFYCC